MMTQRSLLSCLIAVLCISAPLANAGPKNPNYGGLMTGNYNLYNQAQKTPAQQAQTANQNTTTASGMGQMGGMNGGYGTQNQTQSQTQSMQHQTGFGMTQSRMFSSLDADGDTNISLDEFMVQTTEHATDRFDVLDTDGNGLLSMSEFQSNHWGPAEGADIDMHELNACVGDHGGSDSMYPMYPLGNDASFDTMDSNGDSVISLEEFINARKDIVMARFDLIDTDSDAVISKPEMDALLGTMRGHHDVRQACIDEQHNMSEIFSE